MARQETTRHQSTFGATLAGILDRRKGNQSDISLLPEHRLDDRHILITGANKGLGLGISTLAAQRGATVWMACRSDGTEARRKVMNAAGHDRVHLLPVDLMDISTIDALAHTLAERGVELDVVVCNAGMVPVQARDSGAGLNAMNHVNWLAKPALMQALLREGVLQPGRTGPIPRVIFVGSEAHRSAPPIDFDDAARFRSFPTSQVVAEYGKSKLLLHTWVGEFIRRMGPAETSGLPQLSVHHLCPGAINSSIAREAPAWMQPLLKITFALFFQAPIKAAEPVLYLAAAPELEGQTGTYLHMKRRREPSEQSSDPAEGERIWTLAEHLIDTRLRA